VADCDRVGQQGWFSRGVRRGLNGTRSDLAELD